MPGKSFLTALIALALSTKALHARGQEQGGDLIGLGAASIPDAPGSDGQRLVPLPVLSMRFAGTPFYAGNPYGGSPLQAGVAWPAGGELTIGTGVSLQPVKVREANARERAAGVENIDGDALGSAFVHWHHAAFSATLNATQALGSSTQGRSVDLRLQHTLAPTPRLRLSYGSGLTWSDAENMQSWFGVPLGSSELPYYAPSSGIQQVYLQVSAGFALSPRWIIGMGLRFGQLQDDAADSPLAVEDNQHSAWAFVARRF